MRLLHNFAQLFIHLRIYPKIKNGDLVKASAGSYLLIAACLISGWVIATDGGVLAEDMDSIILTGRVALGAAILVANQQIKFVITKRGIVN